MLEDLTTWNGTPLRVESRLAKCCCKCQPVGKPPGNGKTRAKLYEKCAVAFCRREGATAEIHSIEDLK